MARAAFWEIVRILGLTGIKGPGPKSEGSLPWEDIKKISEAIGVPYDGERVRTWRLVIEHLGGTVDEDADVSSGGTIENPGLEKVRDLLLQGGAVANPDLAEPTVPVVAAALDAGGQFTLSGVVDERAFTTRAIAVRQGQPAFRAALLIAYGGKCAVTETGVEAALEAAHIDGYKGPTSNHVQNGLLLRCDVHTLFDLGRIGLAESGQNLVVVVRGDIDDDYYRAMHGQVARLPLDPALQPSREALQAHRTRWGL